MAQAGPGKIRLFNDFCGPEFPVENAVAYATSPTHAYLGDFCIKGEVGDTAAGVVALAVPSGAVRIGGNDLENKGIALGTELCFSVPLNGPLICEARVQCRAVTTRNLFVGFCGTAVDDMAPPSQSTGTTHTLTATDQVGFHIDTSLTATATWHAIYNGGTTTGATDSTVTTTGVVAVAGEWDVLRVEVYPDGTVEYWLNGNMEFRVANAATITSTDMLGAFAGCWGTTTTTNDMDVDYLLVNANRDWTR